MGCSVVNGDAENEDQYYNKTGKYIPIRDGLYENLQGDLFFRVQSISRKGEIEKQYLYLNRFSFPDSYKPSVDPTLSELIDRNTWKQLTNIFYRDKSRIYCHVISSGGGYLKNMDSIVPNDFMFFYQGKWRTYNDIIILSRETGKEIKKNDQISWYTSYKSKVYYNCLPLPGADPVTFDVIRPVEGFVAGHIAKDKHRIYDGDRVMLKSEVRAMANEFTNSTELKKREFAKAILELLDKE
jgi:hypothetical protein